MNPDERSARMDATRQHAGLSVQDLWLGYLSLGGTGDAFELDGYLQGLMPLDSAQQDVLAQTLNDALIDLHDAYRIPSADPCAPAARDDTHLRQLVNDLLDRTDPLDTAGDRPAPEDTDDGVSTPPE